MATFTAVFPPASDRGTQVVLGATTASGDQLVTGKYTIFVITASVQMNIRFGNATSIANADATDFPIWPNTYVQFQMPNGDDRFRLFNPTAGSGFANYFELSRS